MELSMTKLKISESIDLRVSLKIVMFELFLMKTFKEPDIGIWKKLDYFYMQK